MLDVSAFLFDCSNSSSVSASTSQLHCVLHAAYASIFIINPVQGCLVSQAK